MEDGKLLCDDGPGDDSEEVRPPPGIIRRFRTLPPELDVSVENGRRGSPFANGLRHHHSDESDYRPCGGCTGRLGEGGSRYTSLRDVLPSPSAPSPTAAAAWPHEGEISIRNRLVKQAAYAYLQPMAAVSPGSAPGRGLHQRLGCDADGCFGIVRVRLVPVVRRALGQVFERFRRMFAAHGR
ncbi:hypothetical protein Taro_010073 [Colocasia esculenta]|uniref:Uncharacterized protein n=1 Tax=Colocasia esculenta TaxID=4460 RepID=A0A843U5Y1_COLES|nr:hypothetical protein [Colocasia esculenta]